jgi:ribosomal protein S18 acetylase RimI-like enzyme
MAPIELRPATPEDRPRIVEISSQIWDGHDYVPELLDEWFADAEGEVVGAVLDGGLVGFARRTWLAPRLAWFEGIRTDPASRGRGAGRAITEHLIHRAEAAGAERISLSTYVDNEASIHIIESCGFERVATFVYRERPADAPPIETGPEADPRIVAVTEGETIDFVADSPFLRLANRRFPRGWRFFPFDHDPATAVARMSVRLGWRSGDRIEALLCSRWPPGAPKTVVNFLDGEPEAMRELLRHALALYPAAEIAFMVPAAEGRVAAVDPLLDEHGFALWADGDPDVFLYELSLEGPKDGG